MVTKKVKALSAAFVVTMLFLVGMIYADTNGVWHRAEDVRGGIFGDNEVGVVSYTFQNEVIMQNDLNVAAGNITDGTYNVKPAETSNMNTVKVDTIESNRADGNVVIQLGP